MLHYTRNTYNLTGMRKPHNILKGRVTFHNFIGSYEFVSKIHNKKCLRQTVRFWDIHIKITILEYQNKEWKRHEDKNWSNKYNTFIHKFNSIISDTNIMSTGMSFSFGPKILFSWENLSLNTEGSICKVRMLCPSLCSMHKESIMLCHSIGQLTLQEYTSY